MKYTILLFSFLLTFSSVFAQINFQGKVVDNKNDEPLIGATVQASTGQNFITNSEGNFEVSLPIADSVSVTIRYIGYQVGKFSFFVRDGLNSMTFRLKPSVSVLDDVVVSSSRYEKNVLQEGVSIEVLKPDFLEKNQVTQLDQIIQRVPGIQVIDEQVSIRGSGFSFGAGSRVNIVLDGLPILAPEASTVPWNFIPLENIAQIEVLKGASSVLYGTAAMNGVISVRSAYPTAKPYTSIQVYEALYDEPRSEYRKWWRQAERPAQSGVYVAHRRKIGQQFDLVVGGHAHNEISYLQGANERRYRFNINTRYRVTDQLTIGLNANYMEFSKGFFRFWRDGDTLSLRPSEARITPDTYGSLTIDPFINYFDKFGNEHSLKTRFYDVTFLRINPNTPNTTASITHTEYQYYRNFKSNFRLTAGASSQSIDVESPIFPLDSITGLPTNRVARISGLYAQAEKDFFDEKLKVILGGRWEVYAFEGLEQAGIPVFRTSFTYTASPKDYLRLSFGQGYRIPSIAEQFAEPTGALNVFPNPNLKPEYGLTTEIGYKRAFKNDWFNGYFDAALFFMDMNDLIESRFGFYAPDTTFQTLLNPDYYGFTNINVTRARIGGFELGANISGKMGDFGYRIWGGYTYTYPGDLSADTSLANFGNYLRNFGNALFSMDSTVEVGVLNYRNLHNVRLDLELYLKKFTLGFAANYQSWMVNVDDILVGEGFWGNFLQVQLGGEVFPGVKQYRDENYRQGDWVFDLRLRYDVTDKFNVNFVVNNLLNREYAQRVGRMSPLRLFTLKCQITL